MIRAMVFLLVGAIVNVAVAWTIEARTNLYHNPVTLMSKAQTQAFRASGGVALGDDAEGYGMQTASFGAAVTIVPYARSDPGVVTHAFLYDWRYGWPLRSLMSDALVSATGRPERLPVRPIWLGFAIDTLFYAAILWLLFAAPFAMRRRIRIGRGLCPKCGYDLRNRPRDSSACPECGERTAAPLHAA
jgi:hypothetical protein